jgi:hypothetical protein
MSKITTFDGSTARLVGQQAADALKEFAEKLGLTVSYGGGSFESTEFTLKVKLKVADVAVAADAEKAKWDRYATMLGMPAEAFGRTFISRGDTWRIVGLMPSRPKFCLRAKNIFTGKEMLFPAHQARIAA